MFFRIKRSTQLKKLMNAYCDRQSVEMNAIAFLFDGRRLRAEQTPDEVFFFLINVLNLIICSIIYELKSSVSMTTMMLFIECGF